MQDLLFNFISKFVSLTEDEKKAIAAFDIFRSVKKGTVLLKEGQLSNNCYFVLKGCLRTYYIIDGDEKTTAFYTEMEGITPHCVMSGNPSVYYIAAVEDTIITASTPEMEHETFAKFPKFETLCRMFSEQELAKSQLTLDDFKTSSPEQRYLKLLRNRPDLLQRVPQHQIASFLGITPQSLSRIRTRISGKT
ncbi:Crp/Fnr family transcriptional regulator [Parapedobacter sp. ISTM3]|uniref:cAMP-binding domain of CRP or a regulatory subunit of cAMP-dependent protein kinases n=1 Tax=Parapedobacter luteus TaxID=623280 RepID=A0A1T5BT01_9SPHI|nr:MULTISPECIES: Crp/Fnr family transcriptional regulator [Parapedobacter]MBK1439979.1 Crp/Fnr family transcriptional regulator [Parapedobacter sp. ISTM3]SKB50492.1 cAMP-binding domain of CRP or a regulatory subunit of cAMP-dependent protein kinases [Parapedobacter luteus]